MPFLRFNGCDFLFKRIAIIVEDPTLDVEWMIPYKHEIETYASCIDINFLTVGLTRYLLWSHVQNCTNFLLVRQLDTYPLFG